MQSRTEEETKNMSSSIMKVKQIMTQTYAIGEEALDSFW
jgi:hypothetical protein